jgi:hypothetical protein
LSPTERLHEIDNGGDSAAPNNAQLHPSSGERGGGSLVNTTIGRPAREPTKRWMKAPSWRRPRKSDLDFA